MEAKKILILLTAVFGMSLISCESTSINEELLELEKLETQLEGKKKINESNNKNKSSLQKVVDVRGMG
ncbi:hypothetical protein D1818_00240 [Aquimarina sp. BL5]|uniref:hypothetical protein n=1 Tax=Aquimarina sp. BL5 TaxID=1714860 RepID=UPI000E4962DE|nr:hypothetical protein [Aquimarina sp. BL5]AXT49321.1 hypothetical protein D1818_00240 [Aquimarina sp. BL5]